MTRNYNELIDTLQTNGRKFELSYLFAKWLFYRYEEPIKEKIKTELNVRSQEIHDLLIVVNKLMKKVLNIEWDYSRLSRILLEETYTYEEKKYRFYEKMSIENKEINLIKNKLYFKNKPIEIIKKKYNFNNWFSIKKENKKSYSYMINKFLYYDQINQIKQKVKKIIQNKYLFYRELNIEKEELFSITFLSYYIENILKKRENKLYNIIYKLNKENIFDLKRKILYNYNDKLMKINQMEKKEDMSIKNNNSLLFTNILDYFNLNETKTKIKKNIYNFLNIENEVSYLRKYVIYYNNQPIKRKLINIIRKFYNLDLDNFYKGKETSQLTKRLFYYDRRNKKSIQNIAKLRWRKKKVEIYYRIFINIRYLNSPIFYFKNKILDYSNQEKVIAKIQEKYKYHNLLKKKSYLINYLLYYFDMNKKKDEQKIISESYEFYNYIKIGQDITLSYLMTCGLYYLKYCLEHPVPRAQNKIKNAKLISILNMEKEKAQLKKLLYFYRNQTKVRETIRENYDQFYLLNINIKMPYKKKTNLTLHYNKRNKTIQVCNFVKRKAKEDAMNWLWDINLNSGNQSALSYLFTKWLLFSYEEPIKESLWEFERKAVTFIEEYHEFRLYSDHQATFGDYYLTILLILNFYSEIKSNMIKKINHFVEEELHGMSNFDRDIEVYHIGLDILYTYYNQNKKELDQQGWILFQNLLIKPIIKINEIIKNINMEYIWKIRMPDTWIISPYLDIEIESNLHLGYYLFFYINEFYQNKIKPNKADIDIIFEFLKKFIIEPSIDYITIYFKNIVKPNFVDLENKLLKGNMFDPMIFFLRYLSFKSVELALGETKTLIYIDKYGILELIKESSNLYKF